MPVRPSGHARAAWAGCTRGRVYQPAPRPTDPPEAVRAAGRKWMVAWPLPRPRLIVGWGCAVSAGPPQLPHSCAPELASLAPQLRPRPSAQCWDGQGRRGGLRAHECAGDASQVQKYRLGGPAAEPTGDGKHDRECSRPSRKFRPRFRFLAGTGSTNTMGLTEVQGNVGSDLAAISAWYSNP